jgi:peptide-methionine (S)-S-oxide reductase
MILYSNEEQRIAAIASKERLQNQLTESRTIVTDIRPLQKFYTAEEYHQHYFAKRKMGNHVN